MLQNFDLIITDRGSKYSVSGAPALNKAEALAAVKALKKDKRYAKATHNTWGMILSDGGPVKQDDGEAGAGMVLYPLSAFRAMNKAALTVYENILEKGDQKDVVDLMQTRMELYDFLNYHDFEQKLDELFQQKKG